MKVAILSESSADEAALRILVDQVLGTPTTAPPSISLRSRGWSAVRENFHSVAKFLHYRTDAEGLVVVVDSNHTYLSRREPKNRLGEFQELAQQCQRKLSPVPGRVPLKLAIGVAAPAIEAWLLCQSHPHITEAAWEQGLDAGRDPYSKLELKQLLYGQEYFSLALETQKMVAAAQSLKSHISLLERSFPLGFGGLANELRGWRKLGHH